MIPRITGFLHGGDYNPDQWLDRPDILEKDIELMHAAHVNCVSVGIFSWAMLEPEEGKYDFAWLDQVIDRLYKGGIYVILATPSAARPAWMAQHHEEVLRVNTQHLRMHFGERHNHCLTSPYYREKVRQINTALAQRYAAHPAVILWHLGNEFGGECHCPLCQQAFRDWLKEKYTTLENLNQKWWTAFWSHRYTDWAQIEAPSLLTDRSNLAMRVDWQRFMSHQCKTFIAAEREAVQSVSPKLPCTANLMERFWDYDYFSLAESMDIVSWDSYPEWHNEDNIAEAAEFAMNHDLMRSLKKQPFLLMESTPSQVNWKPRNKLKRPGMHLLSSLQAVAHGSDSVQYFQWRKGRGGSEMFHGAVVGHDGTGDTRVFRDVAQVGKTLEKLEKAVYQKPVKAQVCILFDWENRWAIDFAQTGQKGNMRYFDTVNMHYRALWEKGIAVDFCDMRESTDLTGYKLVIAPMLFMLRGGMEEKLRDYVQNGGALVMTYFSGMVDEYDLACLGEAPHGLTDVLGIRATELDALYPGQENGLVTEEGRYGITELCEILQLKGAKVLGTYESDFYAGSPCLTHHTFGKGQSWYLAAKTEQAGLNALYGHIADALEIDKALPDQLPCGVVAAKRGDCVFVQNYTHRAQTLQLTGKWINLLTDVPAEAEIAPFGVWVLQKA
ncbi:MAG: beta-galactosidase [Clostridia bacterium]|nr:beta-galactosidase [Clostridia bacterium]